MGKKRKKLRVVFFIASAGILLMVLACGGMALAEGIPSSLGKEVVDDLPSDQQTCLRLPDGHSSVPLRWLGPQFDCELKLPVKDLRLTLLYDQQSSDRGVTDPSDLMKDLRDEANALVRSLGTISFLDQLLEAEFEFSHSSATRLGQPEPTGNDEGNRIRLGLKGEWDRLKYRAEYGFFDQGFTNLRERNSTPQDYAWGKFGTEFSMGILTPKVELARFHNSVAEDPTQSMTSAGKVSVDVKVPRWPVLTLAYGRALKENRARSTGRTMEDVASDTISGTLWYGRSNWDAYVTSTYSSKQDRRNKDSGAAVYDYILGGSYRLIESLSIHPSFEFIQTTDAQSDYRYETLSANLGIDVSLTPEWPTLSFYGSLTASHDSAGYVDTQSLATSIGLAKHLGDIFGVPDDSAKLSLTLKYNRYADRIYEDANTEGYSAVALLEMNF